MEVFLIINPKEWIRCYCCGDRRKGVHGSYRGRMYWKEDLKKYKCNRCDFSFSPKDLTPKKEFIEAVKLMKQLVK